MNRRRFSALSILPIAASLANCSQTDDQQAPSGVGIECTAGSSCAVPPACSSPWERSWDFAFTNVSGYPADVPLHPSDGITGRVDVRCSSAGLEARVQPDSHDRYGYPQAASVVITSDAIVLGDTLKLEKNGSEQGVRDSFAEIRIPLLADGSLQGTFTATGSAVVCTWLGNTCQGGPALDAAGTIGVDTTAPILDQRVSLPDQGLGDSVLPWDPIDIQVSEGLDGEELAQRLQVVSQSDPAGGSTADAWQTYLPADSVSWSGVTGLRTRLSDWVASSQKPQMLRLTDPVSDPAGHAAVIREPALRMVPIQPMSELTFGQSSDVAMWGQTTWFSADAPGSAACDGAACVLVGPVSSEPDNIDQPGITWPASGFAGAVQVGAGSSIRVRYRALSAGAVAPPVDAAWRFSLDVIDAQGTHDRRTLAAPQATWEALKEPSAGWTFATQWFEEDVALPAGQPVVGVVVWAGGLDAQCPASETACGFAVAEIRPH